jgi:hypothetical protein
MKKIIFGLLLVVSIMSFNKAASQQLKFYYYPESNLYYDVVNRQYIYLNNGTWTTVHVLPATKSDGGRKVVVYHSGRNIWVDNAAHLKKYSTPPRGKAVGYKGTNPNKNGNNPKSKGKSKN